MLSKLFPELSSLRQVFVLAPRDGANSFTYTCRCRDRGKDVLLNSHTVNELTVWHGECLACNVVYWTTFDLHKLRGVK